MKLKLLLAVSIFVAVALLYVDRQWLFGRVRSLAVPALLLLLAVLFLCAWFLGVLLTRLLDLPDTGAVYILGLGASTLVGLAGSVVVIRLLLRKT